MNWLRKMMYGRYGGDQLTFFLLILSIAITVVSLFVPVSFLSYISLVPLIFGIFRMFSKDIAKRQQENMKYLKFQYAIKSWFKNIPTWFRTRKQYKYFKCPQCGQKVRVPRGKGTVNITCPKCSNKFKKKT
ncbi:zinc-ribbon domain-containing protein [Christensenellaceae bacterium OttesenSCG-928-K19]|nr:zinc-ribbon domain-containing protein [Christensenellaceae bacterium OttesenSCG-928-K19]